MFIIAGLGNPGQKYTFTRHNAGFLAVDILAKRLNIDMRKFAHKAQIGEGRLGGQRIVLAKPQTYMNLSGQSIVELINWYKIDPVDELIVIYDDIDLDAGEIRVRAKGSSGTHNGMKSIIYLTGSDQFPRVRIGIGPKNPEWDLADFVLATYRDDEKDAVWDALNKAADAVNMIVADGVDIAQKAYNKKKKKPKEDTNAADSGDNQEKSVNSTAGN